ncbi:prohibitin [Chloropicon primus]|uniref:Prohibitin n=1 Tax=Chloropicon primus TaxID=1764295 RepID=A0A5B8MYC8_9CHLO|nr:prohibitin [Chloropicon primus]UPR03833.1 prohibitin [Chloropicon primus]|eukprot:QDZ24625.1 prohibitin [Chloropicon primus]
MENMEKIKNLKMPKGSGRAGAGLGALLGAAGLGIYTLSNCLFNVEGGHRAIVFNRVVGIKNDVYAEGTHLMVPWFERPIIYDVRLRPQQISSATGTRDLQTVNITLRVLSRPKPTALPQVYRTLGLNYENRVLPSIITETLKSVIAQYNASQLLTMREAVSAEVRRRLTTRASYFNIDVDDVSIKELTFGKDYTQAVESKQVAQQEAERAKFWVERAEQEKKSAIIRAQGEAESAKLIGKAIANNPSFITLRKIEAARHIGQVISRSNNRVFLNTDSLLLNLSELEVGKAR